MRYAVRLLLSIQLLFIPFSSALAHPSSVSASWLKQALAYGFAMQTTDYTRYMSPHYIEHIDGKVFNFSQWLHHMASLKGIMKSYSLSFDEIVSEGNNIAASYVVHAIKKDNSKLDIRIIAIFRVENGKMVYCDELTHVLTQTEDDKAIGSRG